MKSQQYKTKARKEHNHQPIWLFLLISIFTTTIYLKVPGEDYKIAALFLFIGIFQGILLPMPVNILGGLGVVTTWLNAAPAGGGIVLENTEHILITFGITLGIFFSIMYKRDWLNKQQAFQELRESHLLLFGRETESGLASPEIAELRILEELERVEAIGGELGILLFRFFERGLKQTNILQNGVNIQQTIARALKGIAKAYDLPIQMDNNTIGIILLARNRSGLIERMRKIILAVRRTRFVSASGKSHALLAQIVLKYSWIIENTRSLNAGPVEAAGLLKAVQKSLEEDQSNQNLDWRNMPTQPSLQRIRIAAGANGNHE